VVARAKTRGARRAARQAARSPVMAGLARAGLVARGVLYVIVGWIALEVAFGGSGRHAESSGALRLAAASAAGSVALWLLAIGFAGLALWRLSEVIWGAAGPGGRPAGTRLASLARTVIYGVLAFTILKYALGLGAPASSNTQSRDLTAAAGDGPHPVRPLAARGGGSRPGRLRQLLPVRGPLARRVTMYPGSSRSDHEAAGNHREADPALTGLDGQQRVIGNGRLAGQQLPAWRHL
jgi:hypothetical protein